EEIGFAILVGHGTDVALYDEIAAHVQDLFTRFSLEDKLRFRARRHGSINQGYFPILETSDIHPDLVEGWVFCRRAFDVPDRLGREGGGRVGPESAVPASESRPRASMAGAASTAGDRPDFRHEFWPDVALEPMFRRLVAANERLLAPVMQSILEFLNQDPHLY